MSKKLSKKQEKWAEDVARKASLEINSLIEGLILKKERKEKLSKLLGKDDEEKN